nr:MAG TPA_asm: hypothetical protein [Bacteriophage sp.]
MLCSSVSHHRWAEPQPYTLRFYSNTLIFNQ